MFRGRGIRLLITAAAVAAIAFSSAAQDSLTVNPELALDVLTDGAAADSARQGAANVLVLQCDSIAVRDRLAEVLAGPVSGAGGCRYVLTAIARLPRVPDRLYPTLSARVAATPEWELPSFLSALSRFRTRDSARLLLIYAKSADTDVATAAMRALAELSGRDDIPATPTSWARWFESVEQLSERAWQDELVSALAMRSARLSAERADATGRLIASLRQLYIASEPAARPELLAGWMGDAIPEIRDLGLELTRRELSVTGRLDPTVGMAALKLIENPDPTVRSRAAVLVRQLAPDGAPSAIAQALDRETDPVAAADLLLASARWPSSITAQASIAWLQREGPARDAAAEACCSLARAAVLTADQRASILSRAREIAAGRPSAPMVCLLYALGTEVDIQGLVPLLDDPSAPVRSAAADALIWDPELAGRVVAAAARFDDLFDAASRAVLVHNPTAAGFLNISKLSAPSDAVRKTSLLRLGRGMRATDLLAASAAVGDRDISRSLLEIATSPERVMAESFLDESRHAILAAGESLARSDIDSGHPDAALVRLETLPTPSAEQDADAIGRIRLLALLALGRLDVAAEDQRAPVEVWLEGLSLAKGKEHEAELATLIESRFAGKLDEAQLAKVKASLAKPAPQRDEKK
ncbi:MAG: hypothetical protein ACOYN0_05235 [Phycisphaerales bacterium]